MAESNEWVNETNEYDEEYDLRRAVIERVGLRPPGEYVLFDSAAEQVPRRILELGIDSCQRAECLLGMSALIVPVEEIIYYGLDWFDARTGRQRPGMSFMQAMTYFREMGVSAKLFPGDPAATFLNVANALTAKKVDWIMISEEVVPKTMIKIWPLLPRILAPQTRVFVEKQGVYKSISPNEVERIAEKAARIIR